MYATNTETLDCPRGFSLDSPATIEYRELAAFTTCAWCQQEAIGHYVDVDVNGITDADPCERYGQWHHVAQCDVMAV